MNKLRLARLARDHTLTEASRLTGINVGNLSRIERGLQMPSIDSAFALCDLYGLTLDEIYSRPTSRPAQPATGQEAAA